MTGAALVLSVVDTCTGESHLVAIETAALHRRSGRYPTLCGAEVPTASLTTPPARHCQDCAKRAQGVKQAQGKGGEGTAPRRRTLLRRDRAAHSRGRDRHDHRHA